MNKDRKNLLVLAAVLLVGGGVAFLLMRPSKPEPVKGSVYYTGPMVNKSRTAVVDEAGNIVKKLDPNRADKDGTMAGQGRNAPADADVATPGEGARPSGN